MQLPQRLFYTGVPGSKWSSMSHEFEKFPDINLTDYSKEREYEPVAGVPDYAPGKYSDGPLHRGSYFGKGMEFEPILDADYIDQAWTIKEGFRIVKSHDWAYMLDDIVEKFPNDWIMLVYRPDMVSYSWWFNHGGFKISYAKYDAYENHHKMLAEIGIQNESMLKFAHKHDLKWGHFNEKWILENFGREIKITRPKNQWEDILVTIYKPDK